MDKSEAKRDYKRLKRPMGVYRIRNIRDDKSYVGFSMDLKAGINRNKTELKFGSHRNRELLKEWKEFGELCFEFEILDELAHEDNTQADPVEELRTLAEMWMRKLEAAACKVVRL